MKTKILLNVILLIALTMIKCARLKPTVFIHQEYNFEYIERIAVIPFENLSKELGAGMKVTRLFVAELLSAEAFEIVEPGEVSKVLEKHHIVRTSAMTQKKMREIGKALSVQAFFMGTVNESSTSRGASSSINIVTLITRLIDAEKGVTVWSATHTERGGGGLSFLFGLDEKSKSEITRICISKTIQSLFK